MQTFLLEGIELVGLWRGYRAILEDAGWRMLEGAEQLEPRAVLIEHASASASLRFHAHGNRMQVSILVH